MYISQKQDYLSYFEKLPLGINDSLLTFFPKIGVIQLEKMVQILPLTLEEVISDSTLILKGIQVSFKSVVRNKDGQ